MKNVKIVVYDNLKALFEDLLPTGALNKELGRNYIFRGERTDRYRLIPSALRPMLSKRGFQDEN